MKHLRLDRVLPVEYIEKLKQLYPHLNTCRFCARLYFHIRFKKWVSDTDSKVVIPWDQLCIMADEPLTVKIKDTIQRNSEFLAYKRLDEFNDKVLPIKRNKDGEREWSYEFKKAREIHEINFSAEDEQLYQTLLSGGFKGQRAYFISGKTVNSRTMKEQREEDLEVAKDTQVENPSPAAMIIKDYMNALPPQVGTKTLKYMDSADAALQALNLDKEEYEKVTVNFRLLEAQPVTIYSEISPVTTRLFPVNYSPVMIHRKMRREVCHDMVELDLKAANLAIMAQVWNIPELKEFLKNNHIWTAFAEFLNVDLTVAKDSLKDATYAFVFGGGDEEVLNQMKDIKDLCDITNILEHPEIKRIKAARNRMLAKLIADGGMVNADGKFVKMQRGIRPLSILSGVIQSYEAKMLAPAFTLAKGYLNNNRNGFKICLYQYDGFSVEANDKSRLPRIIEKLQGAVNEEAKRLNIPTFLEVAYVPEHLKQYLPSIADSKPIATSQNAPEQELPLKSDMNISKNNSPRIEAKIYVDKAPEKEIDPNSDQSKKTPDPWDPEYDKGFSHV